MANKVSIIIQLQDRFSREANKIRTSVQRVTTKFDSFNRKIKKSSQRLAILGKKAKETSKRIANLGQKLIKGLTLPLTLFGAAALVQSAKLETLAVSFETMAGSVEKGKKLLEELTQFTATTPFQLEGVGKSAKTLLAFKVTADEMIPTLRMLGDIAAGTSAPLSDIALIFGKARAKGKLMTEELLQFAERGIPIIDVLSKKFNVNKARIFDLASKSKISFALMENALESMTLSGGIFFEQTIRQSKTLAGRWSTLMDNIALTSAVFGDALTDALGLKEGLIGLSDFLTTLREKITAFAKTHPLITKILIIFTAIMAVLGPLTVLIAGVVFAFGSLAAAGAALSAVIVPLLIASGVIAALVVAGVLLVRHWDTIKEAAKSLWEKVTSFLSLMKDNAVSLFSDMIAAIIDFGKSILEFAIKPISAVIDKFSKLKGLVSNFIFGGKDAAASSADINPLEIKSKQAETLRSQTDISVTLRAPENVIESTKIKSSGNNRGLNVGMNMLPEGV